MPDAVPFSSSPGRRRSRCSTRFSPCRLRERFVRFPPRSCSTPISGTPAYRRPATTRGRSRGHLPPSGQNPGDAERNLVGRASGCRTPSLSRPHPAGGDPGAQRASRRAGYANDSSDSHRGRARHRYRVRPRTAAQRRPVGARGGTCRHQGRTLVTRSEIWWVEHPDAGRRPFLVLTRQAAIPVLNALLAVPATRTIRQIPTEVVLDTDIGYARVPPPSDDPWALAGALAAIRAEPW